MYPATPSWARQPQVLVELKLANTQLGEFTRGNYKGERGRWEGASMCFWEGGASLFFLGIRTFPLMLFCFHVCCPGLGEGLGYLV